MEAGHILGLRLKEDATAKVVLSEVFRRIARWKMVGTMDEGSAPHHSTPMGVGQGSGGFDALEL